MVVIHVPLGDGTGWLRTMEQKQTDDQGPKKKENTRVGREDMR